MEAKLIYLYPWLKVAHLFAVIAWMAGIFYLPRLFVYHADAPIGSDRSETFKIMERRLLRGIMLPSMVLTWAAGLGLVWLGELWNTPWLLAKVAIVAALTGFHFWLAAKRRAFAEDRNTVSSRSFRIANELPTLALLAILVLVVVRPF